MAPPTAVGANVNSILSLSGVTKSFPVRGRPITILDGVTLTICSSEIVGLVGPSGIGKTTLLNIIAGELPVDKGDVSWRMDLGSVNAARSAMIFQDDAVFPWMRIAENVAFSRTIDSKSGRSFALKQAREFLIELGLGDYCDYWPRELSGGMRKRVELARAVFSNPAIMLLDEPFSMLDTVTKSEVETWFLDKLRDRMLAAILVTHDIREAIRLSDRVLVMNGRPASIQREVRGMRSIAFDPVVVECAEAEILSAMDEAKK